MPHQQSEHKDLMENRASLTRFAWLSIGAAVATIGLKTGAYLLTDSVGLLSDAIESVVNLGCPRLAPASRLQAHHLLEREGRGSKLSEDADRGMGANRSGHLFNEIRDCRQLRVLREQFQSLQTNLSFC